MIHFKERDKYNKEKNIISRDILINFDKS